MKQMINIKIERKLTDEEAKYVKDLSDEEMQELIQDHTEATYEMFESEDIFKEYFKELTIEFTA